MARRGGSNQRRAASSWDWLMVQIAATNISAGTPVAFEMAILGTDFDETLFRTEFWLAMARVTDTTAAISIAWGLIVSTERAFPTGSPLPIDDSQLEWIARGMLQCPGSVAGMETASITLGDRNNGVVKSRRRLNQGENILLVFQSLAGSAPGQVIGGISLLSKVSGT